MADPRIPRTDDMRENQSWQLKIERAKADVTTLQAAIVVAQAQIASLNAQIAAAQADITLLQNITGVLDPTDPDYQLQLDGVSSNATGILLTADSTTTRGALSAGPSSIGLFNANAVDQTPVSGGAFMAVMQDDTIWARGDVLKVGNDYTDKAILEFILPDEHEPDPPDGHCYCYFAQVSPGIKSFVMKWNVAGSIKTASIELS